MKKHTFIILAMFVTSLVTGQQQTFLAKENQQLNWMGKAAVGSYAPEGTLTLSKASINMEGETITALEITVNMKSLQQENQQLTKHLKEEDFFYVSKYPQATFIVAEAATIKEGKAVVKGKMTIRGITQEESIALNITRDGNTLLLSFSKQFDRTDYGVNHNSPSIFKRLKENAIADYFNLSGSIEFLSE